MSHIGVGLIFNTCQMIYQSGYNNFIPSSSL